MPPTVQDILDIIETIAPATLAEQWDNVGLMIGNPSDSVSSILLGLDPTASLLDEADLNESNLLITHHPVIFNPLKSIQLAQPDGQFINKAISKKINVISCHTNLDATIQGVSDILATRLGMVKTEPLVAHETMDRNGLGRIGNFNEPVSTEEFINRLLTTCKPPWLLAAGPRPEKISRAAICGGSCSDLAELALQSGAQVFVTSEVKHNTARWAEDAGMWIIDCGHFATENPGMSHFAELLNQETKKHFNAVTITMSEKQISPLQLIEERSAF